MTTSFKELPIVDLAPLSAESVTEEELHALSAQLHEAFAQVGFAYLLNPPLSFSHDDVFGMAKEFFALPDDSKMSVAKRTFRRSNKNTYRGYFPPQPGADPHNLKAGFELGPSHRLPASNRASISPFVLTEPNCFPANAEFTSKDSLETLYAELSSLGNTLLSLLASSLGKNPSSFISLMRNSVSTLRLLHYPNTAVDDAGAEGVKSEGLCCTPHTDSGLLTLLHQDATGGLEVRNADGEWIPAPYVPGSLVVNVGDLMADMSGGRFVATMHRVRSSGSERDSVPFFCEPGINAMVGKKGQEVRYEEFVLDKMGTWVEFQDSMEEMESMSVNSAVSSTGIVAY